MGHDSRSGRARAPLRTLPRYVEPQRLLNTRYLLQLEKWPTSYLHVRTLELSLALLSHSAACSHHPFCQQNSPRSHSPTRQQGSRERQNINAADSAQSSSSKRERQRPPWDSSVERSRGRTSAAAAVCHAPASALQAPLPMRQPTAIHHRDAGPPTAPCEKGTETELHMDRQTQTGPYTLSSASASANCMAGATSAPCFQARSPRMQICAPEVQARPAWRPAGCWHADVQAQEGMLRGRKAYCKVLH